MIYVFWCLIFAVKGAKVLFLILTLQFNIKIVQKLWKILPPQYNDVFVSKFLNSFIWQIKTRLLSISFRR